MSEEIQFVAKFNKYVEGWGVVYVYDYDRFQELKKENPHKYHDTAHTKFRIFKQVFD